jgi:SAM-dependent methyltransferase
MPSPLRRLLERVKRRHPALYWRTRNAGALAAWYADRARPADESPYDDPFWDGAEVGDWDGFARTILHHVSVRSVLDVGCGGGRLLEALRTADPTLRLKGVDASAPALERARRRGLDVQPLDLVRLRAGEVASAAEGLGNFDLVICLEVAEHFPAWHAPKLLALLTRFPTIVFSAAHPLQGGVLHVNEQPAEYWIRRFAERGFPLSARDGDLRADVAALDLPPWYAANIHAFARSGA